MEKDTSIIGDNTFDADPSFGDINTDADLATLRAIGGPDVTSVDELPIGDRVIYELFRD